MTSSHRATMRAEAVCAEPRLWSTQVLSGVKWSNLLRLISPNLLWFKRCQNGIVFGAKLTTIHSQMSLGFVKWAETILNYICTLCVFLCIIELVHCANLFTPLSSRATCAVRALTTWVSWATRSRWGNRWPPATRTAQVWKPQVWNVWGVNAGLSLPAVQRG